MDQPPAGPGGPPFGKRNTAPFWKKVAIVLSAVVALLIVGPPLRASHLNSLLVLVLIIAVVAGVVWLAARLLGVRLGLRSWD
ncbi:MAG TPA: hypothetical protein VK576_05760 [Thermoleophilia bacterium]|nr:hypothetical protein [Thermoleophilia bacterium]